MHYFTWKLESVSDIWMLERKNKIKTYFKCVPLTISYHLYLIRIPKNPIMLHHGPVEWFYSKSCYIIFTYTFLFPNTFLLFFIKKFCFYYFYFSFLFLFLHRISANRILTNQKAGYVSRKWYQPKFVVWTIIHCEHSHKKRKNYVVNQKWKKKKINKLGKVDDRSPILQLTRSRSKRQKETKIWIDKDGFKPC